MLAAVDRLLRGEGLDVLGELGRRAVAELAHAFDEKGLARPEKWSTRHCRLQSLRLARRAKAALASRRVPKRRSRGVMLRSAGVGNDRHGHGAKVD